MYCGNFFLKKSSPIKLYKGKKINIFGNKGYIFYHDCLISSITVKKNQIVMVLHFLSDSNHKK